jgi:hypothetical protein
MRNWKPFIDQGADMNTRSESLFTSQLQPRTATRINLFAVIGFCVIGLACSLCVSPSYLHFDEMAGLALQSSLG